MPSDMLLAWGPYSAALVCFMLTHFLPRVGDLRGRLIMRLGRGPYFAIYGVVSVLMTVWLLVATANAPYVELWPYAAWQKWVPFVAMPFVFVLTAIGVGVETPYTLAGRRDAPTSEAQFGRAAISRHPVLLALTLWAAAHLCANGDLAHGLIFAMSVTLALGAMVLFDRAASSQLAQNDGTAAPRRFFAQAPILSLRPLLSPSWRQKNGKSMAYRAAIGLLLWLVAVSMHERILGVSPLPHW
ncbi:NnrU family protein [Phaeobacter sp.]|uniref:NnrU family protein n=1 Tax=Phaeobacter sp. TaxID=1902409 RepID=UPI0025EA68A3|nr:NnrU family protein [Phaeobacter sp.]